MGMTSGTGVPVEARASRASMLQRCAKLAPTTSILLMKTRRGTPYLFACRQTVSDCASTPFWRVEDDDRAVEHAQAALDLGGEIDVAGRVDQVDRAAAPLERDAGASRW